MKLLLMISHSGAFSRRKAFDAIRRGAVTINGRVEVEPSTEVDPVKDEIICSSRLIGSKRFEYILLNKPQGYVTTCEGQFSQRTVIDLLPAELRHLRPVGRLDKDTEGLLLLTNDGELANKLMHPGFDVDKTYLVRVRWNLIPKTALRLEQGVVIGGQKTAPATVKILRSEDKESEIEITIHEGRKRQVRLMMDTVGHPVVYLSRLRQGPLALGNLAVAAWRRLTEEEIARLREITPQKDVSFKTVAVRPPSPRREEAPAVYQRRGAERSQEPRREFRPRQTATERPRFAGRPDRAGSAGSPRAFKSPRLTGPRPAFSSRAQVVRNAGTREWHSDSDVHGPSARPSFKPAFRPRVDARSDSRGDSRADRPYTSGRPPAPGARREFRPSRTYGERSAAPAARREFTPRSSEGSVRREFSPRSPEGSERREFRPRRPAGEGRPAFGARPAAKPGFAKKPFNKKPYPAARKPRT